MLVSRASNYLLTYLISLSTPLKLRHYCALEISLLFFFTTENPWWLKNFRNKLENLLGSEPYSGWSSSIKPSCSKTESKRCTTTEIRWNKNENILTSNIIIVERVEPCLFQHGGRRHRSSSAHVYKFSLLCFGFASISGTASGTSEVDMSTQSTLWRRP